MVDRSLGRQKVEVELGCGIFIPTNPIPWGCSILKPKQLIILEKIFFSFSHFILLLWLCKLINWEIFYRFVLLLCEEANKPWQSSHFSGTILPIGLLG